MIDKNCDFLVQRFVLKRCLIFALITLNVVYQVVVDSCGATPELLVGRGFRTTFAATGCSGHVCRS